MKVIDLPLDQIKEAPWNPNSRTPQMTMKLRESISRFDLVENLVARPLQPGAYEVLSGKQRLGILRDLGYSHAPCVVVELDDARARLLAQSLNRIQGEDDLGLKAELMRKVLKQVPEGEVISLLPETANSLQTLASMCSMRSRVSRKSSRFDVASP